MLTLEGQPLPPPDSASAWPTGATTLATALVVGGLALLVYAWRVRVMRRTGLLKVEDQDADPTTDARAVGDDLRELTERLAAELDARADRLERLIVQAEERIATLERAASRVVEVKERPAGAPRAEFAEVYDLADAGVGPIEIARRTGRPTGQVELILNLRRGGVAL
ncbi:MAG: hypothetical protein HBSAPP03_01120 [Phycisphaerae bacterium]|nr:MAG: hypothetical protein HBSAPP03_01120 [Phycisphaerae bacterium]